MDKAVTALLNRPIRTARGIANAGRSSRVKGYPTGHILSKQNDCLADSRGQQHTRIVMAASKYSDTAEGIVESVKTHIVPRESVTQRQHLKLYPIFGETRLAFKGKQAIKEPILDSKGNPTGQYKITGMASFTDERIVGKTKVNNLLVTGNPFKFPADQLKRRTHNSKRLQRPDTDFTEHRKPRDVSINIASDDPILSKP